MMNSLLAFFILMPIAFAQSTSVEVKNFNFNYKDPLGEGTATSFSTGTIKQKVEARIFVEKANDVFLVNVSTEEDSEYELKDAPSFLMNANAISLKSLAFLFERRITLSFADAYFHSAKDEISLQNFDLQCERDLNLAQSMDQVISGCIKSMAMKTGKFSSSLVPMGLEGSMPTETKSNSINALDLKVKAGKYEMNAEVKVPISGKIKSIGQLSYDTQSGKLTVKVTEVKFGFLNITSQVFAELKKNESDRMKVKEPYIYLTLK